MGFLNQSMAQIRDLFATMTPAARITAGLLVCVIGVSLGYLFQDYRGGAKEPLFNGETLTAGEVDRMQGAIAQAALTDFERQGNQLLVPRGQKAEYLAAVANQGALPANLDTLLLDESSELGWMTDSKTRDARWKATRERMLSMIIRKMDGVADANVAFDVREPKGFERRLITATVGVRPASGEALTARRAKMIRAAVAGATAGLDPKDVVILNWSDGSIFEDSGRIAADEFDDKYFQTRTTYEQQMKSRIEDLLRYIPGLRVQVTAELDERLESETRAITSVGETQTVREETNNSEETNTQLEDRGRPGLTAQANTRTPPDEAVAKNEHRTVSETRDADNFVPTTEEVTRMAGLAPKDVRASIAIPSDYLLSIWRELHKDATPEDQPSEVDIENITKEQDMFITNSVSTLLPRQPENAPYKNVRVTVYQSMTPQPTEEPSLVSQTLLWASSNSGSLIMAGLAMASLVMLRGMVKSIPSPETNVILSLPSGGEADSAARPDAGREAQSAGRGGGDTAGGGRPERDKNRPRLRLKKGPSLKDDLTDMVRDDPDSAAAILRTWISNAG